MSYQKKFAAGNNVYEPGMEIIYNDTTHITSIDFRGQCFETEDLLNDKAAMVQVAEDYCRGKGWAG